MPHLAPSHRRFVQPWSLALAGALPVLALLSAGAAPWRPAIPLAPTATGPAVPTTLYAVNWSDATIVTPLDPATPADLDGAGFAALAVGPPGWVLSDDGATLVVIEYAPSGSGKFCRRPSRSRSSCATARAGPNASVSARRPASSPRA